jgi:hypothetical protein
MALGALEGARFPAFRHLCIFTHVGSSHTGLVQSVRRQTVSRQTSEDQDIFGAALALVVAIIYIVIMAERIW